MKSLPQGGQILSLTAGGTAQPPLGEKGIDERVKTFLVNLVKHIITSFIKALWVHTLLKTVCGGYHGGISKYTYIHIYIIFSVW